MKIIRTVSSQQSLSGRLRHRGIVVGFVPTMGYLHEGHLSLVRASKRECDRTVLSIYVNPLQFGPQEDFSRYPRDLVRDRQLTRQAGVDFLFVPDDRQMYAPEFASRVVPGSAAQGLCGDSRPGHFTGVATVVTKLLNIVQPHRVYFGQKDAQQCAVIRQVVKDFNIPVQVRVVPTVREPDGLAMSSRNKYLTAPQRAAAPVLYEALREARRLILRERYRRVAPVIEKMRRLITRVTSVTIEYLSIVRADSMQPCESLTGTVLIAGAIRIAEVRLIDNLVVRIRG